VVLVSLRLLKSLNRDSISYGTITISGDEWRAYCRKRGSELSKSSIDYLTSGRVDLRRLNQSLFDTTLFQYLLHHEDPRILQVLGSALRVGCDTIVGVGSLVITFDESRYVAVIDDDELVKVLESNQL
jgi:hypothetical protein